jgi:RNA polymerase sigma-70 factor, ECF subfamily
MPMVGHATTDSTSDEVEDPEAVGPVVDDRLRLMFTCCHPALASEAQVALTLRLVGGLTVEQIARGLLKSEAAVGQRITRAKAKVASAHIPYRVPAAEDLPERLSTVLSVLYLVFNEGYLPGGDQALRPDLTAEAIRLARLIHELLPEADEATGLLALMLLTDSRRMSRISSDGELVTLGEQDRGGWDPALIAEGQTLVLALIAAGRPPGSYQLQAAINAVHCHASDVRDTDWQQLSTLYDQLFALEPTPVVALNRAVVRAELDGPAVALAEVDRLELAGYHAWHATRADLLRRLGRSGDARSAYDAAISLAANAAEIRFLERRRASLTA